MPNPEQDELVEAEKAGLAAAQEYREECWCDCRSADRDWATKLAIRTARPIIERALLAEVASMLRSIPGESEALHRLGLLAKEKRNLDLSGEG